DVLKQDKQTSFSKEQIQNIVKDAVDNVLSYETDYKHSLVSQWVNNIIETTMKKLTGLLKPFKYVVTCVIMQNNGAGFHTASSCYWETCDGSYIHKMEGKNLYCITSV
ncbi:dynein light chain, partial [Acrasis kona]